MRSMFGKLLFSGFIVSGVLTFGIFAQDLDDVTISGKIVDTNGLSIVGATVTAIRTETGIERTVTTNADGRYRIIELQPGTYSVKSTAQGFGETIKTDLITISGQSVQLDIKLDPAGVVVDPITVTDDDAPTIDTTRTVVGGTITAIELEELPNSSGDVLDLVYTLGGVDEESISTRNLSDDRRGDGSGTLSEPREVTGGGIFSLSGGAAYSTNITIDGLDNNDDRSAEERFQPPVDSIAEVQVITNQFSAEYGRASGGRINIRTKAGARKFRGRAYLFFEDDNLNANTYNNNLRGLSRLPFTEFTPGGTLSGPIPFGYFKNKTFFFSSYEYQNRDANTLIDTALPVAQNPLYPLPTPSGNVRIDKNGFAAQIADYTSQVNTPTLRHRFTQRIDHNFTNNHNITLNYQLGRSKNFRQYRETTRFLDDTLIGRTRDNDSIYFTDNYIFSEKFVNQFRYQYSTFRPDFSTDGTQNPVVILFVSDETRVGASNQVRGSVVLGNSTLGTTLRKENRHQFQNTSNYLFGNHTFRFGGDVQFIESDNTNLSDITGTYNFDNVQDFLDTDILRYRRNFRTQTIQKNTYYGVFFQDDWKARPNLTLSFGLRYERETLVGDKNNFGPRFAVAYSPGDNGKSVIRFGGGIFYNRVLLRTLDDYSLGAQEVSFDSQNLAQLPGTNSTAAGNRLCKTAAPTDPIYNTDKCRFLRLVAQSFPTPPTLDQIRGLQGQIDVSRGFVTETNFSRLVQPGINIPESYQLNLGYERDLGNGFAFEANFTYNKAVRLWRETNINAYVLPSGFNTYTDYLVALGTTVINGLPTRFELGSTNEPIGATGITTVGGVRVVNLNTRENRQRASDPITLARLALGANLNRGYNNALGQVESVSAIGQSVYEGLTVELRRRFRDLGKGFKSSFRFVYVFSRARDDGFVDTSSAQIPGDFKSEFSTSGIDRRHKFRMSGSLLTPGWLGKINISPILRLETGRPFNISIGGIDRNLDDVGNDRSNFVGNLDEIKNATPGSPFSQNFINQFVLPPIGTPGNLPRNAGRGPALFTFDVNFSRRFKLNERMKLQFLAQFDNIFNAKVFTFGSDFINFNEINNPTQIESFRQGFLVPTRTFRPRQVRLGVRFDF